MQWALLDPLGPPERADLLRAAKPRRFARGQTVCRAGEVADGLYLVEAGRLSVQVSTPDGDVAVLNVLGPGDYFGELALLGRDQGLRRTATVTALEPAEVRTVLRSDFDALRSRNPGFERLLTGLLADQVDKLSQRLLEALYLDVDHRVCLRLAELADLYRRPEAPGAIVVPLTQEQLAGLAGATRPTVNQILRRLEERGIVALNRGSISVLDRLRLAAAAGS